MEPAARHELLATTNPGLELVVAAELAEKLGADAQSVQAEANSGKCFFTSSGRGEALQSPENVFAVVSRLDSGLPTDRSGLATLSGLAAAAPSDAWDAAVRAWRQVQEPEPEPRGGGETGAKLPTFCVRACRRETRAGHKHAYTRVDVEQIVGGAIHTRFGWPVDLKQPELNVYVEVADDTAVIAVSLRSEASFKARRRLEMEAGLGATPLRRSTCYAMIHLAALGPGAVCVDAMCGSGSLPIEGAINFRHAVHIGGDITAEDVAKARLSAKLQSVAVDFAPWDSCRLPLRAASVDAVVTDLPFGRRHGSHLQNQSLYPRALREYARVVRSGGRAVMLTMDYKIMKHAVSNNKQFWKMTQEYKVLVGGGVNSSSHGINAILLVLTRTGLALDKYSHRGSKRKPTAGVQGAGGKKKQAVQLTPIQAAESLIKNRDIPGALASFQKLLAEGEHAATCHYKICFCHQRLEDFPAALASIDAALACFVEGYVPLAPANPQGRAAKGTVAERTAREKGNAYCSRGMANWKLGSIDEALSDFENCLELYPKCDSARFKLAEVQKRVASRDAASAAAAPV